MFLLQRLLSSSALILSISVILSCSQDERCDDCSRIASDGVRFKIETKGGVDLFFGNNAQHDPADLEIFYIEDNQLVDNGIIRSTSDFFSTHLEIGRGSQFVLEFDNYQDTLTVEVKNLPTDCEGCPEMEITSLYFNDQLICNNQEECGDEVLTFIVD